jgi:uncharacterized RDD family membrane protein YckC
MEDVTYLSSACPRCGRTLPPDAAEGLCASCLLAAGTGSLTRSSMDDALTVSSAAGEPRADGPDGPRLAADQPWGPYRIGRLLGRGGMGEVYEAEHLETGRRIALKVLRSRLENADDRARFLREGQLAASVSHPHTVYIFGSEEIAGMPVISMELLPGGTLKDRVTAQGPLPPTEAVSAVLDIIGGLDAAQATGILHRDIKPSNCFIDAEGSVKVGDFGLSISTLARDVRHELATAGFEGTPQFAPPEQLRGEPLDVRADIYAVGATLYYLLTGRPPFDSRDLRDLVARVTSEAPQSPRRLRPDIPPGLASVVLQCLAKTPAERPASYAALADALRPYSAHAHTPARLSARLAAGIADSLILGLPIVIWRGWIGDVVTTNATVGPWTWLLSLAYYFALEGRWGASLGKRLMGLRVMAADGTAASWARIARRTGTFYIPNLLLALPFPIAGAAGINAFFNADPNLAIAGSLLTLALIFALFLTARRHNGWAALHDLASGTRVVLRSAVEAPHRAAPLDAKTAAPRQADARTRRRYGPFIPVAEAGRTSNGTIIIGFDPVLRRDVWIHEVGADTPAISTARRDVSRIGRLHWLTGRRSAHENWDAFEAPGGHPFLAHADTTPGWRTLELWLLDLSQELAAGARDGSLPALGLDRLWVRSDGHLVLLDFCAVGVDACGLEGSRTCRAEAAAAPGCAAAKADGLAATLTPVGLLSAVAGHALPARPSADPALLPLSARMAINRWSSASPPTIDQARSDLLAVAVAPDRVVRWRRAVPLAMAAGPILFLVVSTLVLLPALFAFMTPQNAEMFALLESLRNPPAGSRLTDPGYRRAVEVYLAGRHRAVLADPGFWSTRVMQSESMRSYRELAADIVARHPSVSPEEQKEATAAIAPELERGAQRRAREASQPAPTSIVVGVLAALAALLVIGVSAFSAAIVPGGMVTRTMGLAVVTANGAEIGRGRSLARVLVAWLPAIAWLAWLAASPKVQGFVPTWSANLPVAALALGTVALGSLWSIVQPARGIHDRIVGTWMVPR